MRTVRLPRVVGIPNLPRAKRGRAGREGEKKGRRITQCDASARRPSSGRLNGPSTRPRHHRGCRRCAAARRRRLFRRSSIERSRQTSGPYPTKGRSPDPLWRGGVAAPSLRRCAQACLDSAQGRRLCCPRAGGVARRWRQLCWAWQVQTPANRASRTVAIS